jgi:hypothetical protein
MKLEILVKACIWPPFINAVLRYGTGSFNLQAGQDTVPGYYN